MPRECKEPSHPQISGEEYCRVCKKIKQEEE